MRTLRLLNLRCNKTDNDNNTKLDKTFLTVDNGSFHILGPESMMDGSDWNVNSHVQFKEQAKITLTKIWYGI
jgi:hypothetical protein